MDRHSFSCESFLQCGTAISINATDIAVGWGERTWHKEWAGGSSLPFFYFPDFFLRSAAPWFTHPFYAIFKKEELEKKIAPLLSFSEKPSIPLETDSVDWAPFEQAFYSIKSKIAAGQLLKAVPYALWQPLTKMAPHFLPHLLCSYLKKVKALPLYLYGYWDGQSSGMLGATPEKLFFLDNSKNLLETVACAGTCPIEKKEGLNKDAKNEQEHTIVLKDIEERLRDYGKIEVKKQKVVSFGKLAHLITPLTMKITKPFSFEQAVQLLHPTPALGAYPRAEGAIWLEEFENRVPRGRFGAPISCLLPHSEQILCLVAIRAIDWKHSIIQIKAGCGITEKSVLEEEKKEIWLKFSAIQSVAE